MVFTMVSEKMSPLVEAVGRAWLWFRHRFANIFCVSSSHLEFFFADNYSSIAPKPCRFMRGTASSSALQLFFFRAWNIYRAFSSYSCADVGCRISSNDIVYETSSS